MRPIWPIEADVSGAEAGPLMAEIRRQGMPCQVISHRAPVEGIVPEVDGRRPEDGDCVLADGTFPFVRQVPLHHAWIPGGWCDAAALDCASYYPRFDAYLLNRRHAMMPGVEAIRRRDELFAALGRDGRVFVRPAGCHKLFVGRCVARDAFADALAPARYDPEAVVVVAEPRAIGRAWRLVVSEGRVVAASQYASNGKPASAPGCPEAVRAFAERMLAEVPWRPDPIFMLDLGESGGRLCLVELNGFGCSWLDACDPAPVVAAASALAEREREGRMGAGSRPARGGGSPACGKSPRGRAGRDPEAVPDRRSRAASGDTGPVGAVEIVDDRARTPGQAGRVHLDDGRRRAAAGPRPGEDDPGHTEGRHRLAPSVGVHAGRSVRSRRAVDVMIRRMGVRDPGRRPGPPRSASWGGGRSDPGARARPAGVREPGGVALNLDELLRELEPLSHDARVRRMVALGRASTCDPAVAATLAELGRGGVFGRLMALYAFYGSRDGAAAARALADPSRLIRRMALRLIALVADDGQALDALQSARRAERLALLRHLRRRRRTAPVDALLGEMADEDDEALDLLVAYGSAGAVTRHVEAAQRRGGLVFWSRLARHHPDLAARDLLGRAEAATGPDARLVREANAALPTLADARPDAALRLVIALMRHVPIGRLALDPLRRRRPAEVADLLLGTADEARVDLGPVAHRLDDARLLALLRRRPALLADRGRWFARLDPGRRRAVFEAVGPSWRDGEGVLAPNLVALLPGDLREAEGRRHLALPALATRPERRLPYASYVPWDEARRALDPALGHPDGQRRAAALAALAGVVRYERPRLAEYLALVLARRNEQDPIRLAMLSGLAGMPPSCVGAEHLDDLGRVLRDALDAADLSHATATYAEMLVVRLLPRHPGWAAGWLETLARERGQVSLYGLEHRLTDAEVRRIAPAFAPVLRAWQTREREPQVLALATALGRRLRAFDALRDVLERIARESPHSWVAARALQARIEHDRPRAATLIPDLVAEDPSWATESVVYEYLHRRRQDLLTPFLGQRAHRGRFGTGKTRFVLPLAGGFFRWTPSQQATFAKTLQGVTRRDDRLRDTPAVIGAIGQLAALPALDPARLVELARDDRQAVRDAALRALGRLDADQGVAALVEAMGDDRARVAIYALRRALLGMPEPHALDLLRSIPTGKVTVAKEVLRLVGEFPGEAGFALLREWEGRSLHRDVRVALLRAYWAHLERPGAWEAIERAAGAPDPALLAGVVRIPADRLSEASRARLAGLLVRLLDHPDPVVRLEVLGRCVAEPVGDPDRRVLDRALAALGSPLPDERAAAAAVVAATARAEDASRVAGAVATSMPDRRALRALADALGTRVGGDRARLGPVAVATLDALAADPLTAALRVELGVAALGGADLASSLAAMAGAGTLHADALGVAVDALASAASRPGGAGLDVLEAALAASRDDRLRRLALAALIAQAHQADGWSPERLARLRAYRLDPSPLVAAAAQFTLPPDEEGPLGDDSTGLNRASPAGAWQPGRG